MYLLVMATRFWNISSSSFSRSAKFLAFFGLRIHCVDRNQIFQVKKFQGFAKTYQCLMIMENITKSKDLPIELTLGDIHILNKMSQQVKCPN
jgi:hypothetical protein